MVLTYKEFEASQSLLPDLKIISVGYRYKSNAGVLWADGDGSDMPPDLLFSITITNQGTGPFDGPFGIASVDNMNDIDWGAYPYFEFPVRHKNPILPGDTITCEIGAGETNYDFGNPFRFLLVT